MNQKIIIILLLLVGILGLSWMIQERGIDNNKNMTLSKDSSSSGKITKVEPGVFKSMIEKDEIFVIDVHTPEQDHLPGTDAFIPFDEISSRITDLPTDKTQPIAVYCRSGGMSAEAAQTLLELGYTNIYDLSGGAQAYNHQLAQQESVEVSPENRSLGTVIYGEVGMTTFDITNSTTDNLEVTRLSTSCGCTKAEISNKFIGPGESEEIVVSFDPAVHEDDTDLGDITRTIYIETNNPQFKKIERTITATVIKE